MNTPRSLAIHDQTIVIVSNEPWGDVWYVKHHYAVELAKANRVLFVDPPLPWSLRALASRPVASKMVRPNLWVVRYRNPLPARVLPWLSQRVNDALLVAGLRPLVGSGTPFILWQFDPFRLVTVPRAACKRIYHVADDYAHHPNDERIARRADLVCCTSAPYVSRYERLSRNVVHIPHGVSEDEFVVDEADVARIAARHSPFLFYAGGIGGRTDLALCFKIAASLPGAQVVLAGPNQIRDERERAVFERLCELRNVHYLGIIPGDRLKIYIRAARACLLLYRFGEKDGAGGTSSHKVLKYLAQRRVVLTTMEPEPRRLAGRALYHAVAADEFVSLCREALLGQLRVDDEAVGEYLYDVGYSTLIARIADRLGIG